MLTLLDPDSVSSNGGDGANKSQGLPNKLSRGASRHGRGRGIARRCVVTVPGLKGLEEQDGMAIPMEQLPSVVLACKQGQPLLRDSTKHRLHE
jgi:hypothetical protein